MQSLHTHTHTHTHTYTEKQLFEFSKTRVHASLKVPSQQLRFLASVLQSVRGYYLPVIDCQLVHLS